jgi:hypothetical protein
MRAAPGETAVDLEDDRLCDGLGLVGVVVALWGV